MGKYQSAAEVPTPDVPNPPSSCDSCSHPAEILLISVYDDRGHIHTGPFSEYGYRKNGLHLRGNYTYAHWNAVCSTCYTKRFQNKWHRDVWESLGSPIGKDACMKVMYQCNPVMARLIGRGVS